MEEVRKEENNDSINSKSDFKTERKNISLLSALVVLVFVLCVAVVFLIYIYEDFNSELVCGDGTAYYECSENKPYFCQEGFLKEVSSICGCPENFKVKGNLCISSYNKNESLQLLRYEIEGKEKEFYFPVYFGFVEYLRNENFFIKSGNKSINLRKEYKLKKINNSLQREFLLPLLIHIQNTASNEKEQVRIAISLVQNIEYKASYLNDNFFGNSIPYSRYPYEVIFDNQGICSEKVELLGFLLKELGYETIVFYFPNEQHESIGIKCPKVLSYDRTGYCFVETTAPSGTFIDSFSGSLTDYEIIKISDGKALRGGV